jgi:hypothetical protein
MSRYIYISEEYYRSEGVVHWAPAYVLSRATTWGGLDRSCRAPNQQNKRRHGRQGRFAGGRRTRQGHRRLSRGMSSCPSSIQHSIRCVPAGRPAAPHRLARRRVPPGLFLCRRLSICPLSAQPKESGDNLSYNLNLFGMADLNSQQKISCFAARFPNGFSPCDGADRVGLDSDMGNDYSGPHC